MVLRKPNFLLDENLNRLAKWLRLLGYDAAVYKSISFHNAIRLANREHRIFLTRSRKLATSNQKFSRRLIMSVDHRDQLKELNDIVTVKEEYLFSRCILCNKKLFDISKEKIKELIPEFVYESLDEFKLCRKCGRIFWKGSHYKAIKKELKYLLTV
ncbi:MAG: Mut7-C RNAse domain-containing protein [Candidatus Cloacimonetes bacterium]|nr:Mut7-C RNAse domain-containing protein [Candidatus Cloacimonadota bacterium]